MAKLYPPTINENIPAFYKENGTVEITVPFSMNRAVLKEDISGFILKIKTVQGNIQLGTKSINNELEQIIKDKKVIFSLEENNSDDKTIIEKIRVGQFLKVQMAYLDKNDEVGYYSTVGITKYTSKPILSIQGFKTEEDEDYSINHFPTKIVGEYQLGEDKTERPYSYNFSLYDEQDQLLETSRWILYNNNVNNTSNSLNTITTLPYYFRTVSEPNINYKIIFQVRTINNLEVSSPNYECMEINIEELLADDISTGTIKLEKFKFDLHVKNNFEEGYIKLGFKIIDDPPEEKILKSDEQELPIIKNQNKTDAKYPSSFSELHPEDDFFNKENFRYTIVYNALPNGGTAYHYNLWDGKTLKEGVSFYYDINNCLYYIKFIDKTDNLITHWKDCGKYEIFPIEGESISFEICRASNKDNFSKWSVLQRVTFEDTVQAMDWSFKDVTVEQGVQYKYSFRQYNDNGLYSNREETEPIMADFEDIFLCDNEKQIKIRFNPKISSFKTTRLESKIDTIGGKHPFIFRNGIVEYKEFPIQGLISYYLDENEEFFKDSYKELGITFGKKLERLGNSKVLEKDVNQQIENLSTTNLENYNIKAEREFKLKLSDWLSNGEIKLFKSPSEGNYFVRLMNISLSPEDRLNRMIHNFSCQAYEVMNYDYDSLLNLNYYSLENEAVRYIGNIENINIINTINGDMYLGRDENGKELTMDQNMKKANKFLLVKDNNNFNFIVFQNNWVTAKYYYNENDENEQPVELAGDFNQAYKGILVKQDKTEIEYDKTEKSDNVSLNCRRNFFIENFSYYSNQSNILHEYKIIPSLDNELIKVTIEKNNNKNFSYLYTVPKFNTTHWLGLELTNNVSCLLELIKEDSQMRLQLKDKNSQLFNNEENKGFSLGDGLKIQFNNCKAIEIIKKESD